eukprot:g1342.t1
MLRRKPTRIELTTEDVQDYESIKKKAEENKRKQEEIESKTAKTTADKAEQAAKAADAAAAAAAADEPSRRQRTAVTTDASVAAGPGLTSHTGPLIEVGFWADPRDDRDKRPNPAQLVDEDWGKTAAALAVALYLRSGFLESFELGYSFCRLGCFAGSGGGSESRGPGNSNKLMGCTTLTDGKYVWPEGLAHYVIEHSVRVPEEFIKHSLGNLRALREAQEGGRLRWDMDDHGRGRTAPLAPGTAVFLRDKTTLGLALPPEPDTAKLRRSRSRRSEQGICSCVAS